ncbi:MAG: hypothetical protein QM811_01460 [Pirellulales bacterium]
MATYILITGTLYLGLGLILGLRATRLRRSNDRRRTQSSRA